VNLLVDPGSPVDLPVISKKVGQVIGDISKINLFSVNHQDPDVVANAVFLQRMNPKALCIASEDTWRLVAHYELDPAKVRLAEKFKDGKMTLQTGHVVAFLPTPFCHFRGALALYDLESRVLFTGDLFGGLSAAQHKALWANEASWDGIKAFHQIYMPARKVLQRAVASIRALDPKPLIIAPQHGDLLQGEMIDYFLDRVAALPVGADLLEELADPQMLAMIKDAANEVLSLAVTLLGESTVAAKLASPSARHDILAHAAISGAMITGVHSASPELLSILERALSRDEPFEIVNQLRMGGIKAALQRNIPVHTGRLEADDDLIVEPEDDLVS
jgi:serine/threonine-protein kinase